jgi:hypothetical protein
MCLHCLCDLAEWDGECALITSSLGRQRRLQSAERLAQMDGRKRVETLSGHNCAVASRGHICLWRHGSGPAYVLALGSLMFS